jgi:hypothetical protein
MRTDTADRLEPYPPWLAADFTDYAKFLTGGIGRQWAAPLGVGVNAQEDESICVAPEIPRVAIDGSRANGDLGELCSPAKIRFCLKAGEPVTHWYDTGR